MSIINKTRYTLSCKTRYIRDLDTNSRVGVITLVYDKGHFGLGVSLCNTGVDKFDRNEGKRLSYERAVECLAKTPMLLKDLGNVGINRMEETGGFKFPRSTYEADAKVFSTIKAYRLLIDDMIYTLALSKVRAETV